MYHLCNVGTYIQYSSVVIKIEFFNSCERFHLRQHNTRFTLTHAHARRSCACTHTMIKLFHLSFFITKIQFKSMRLFSGRWVQFTYGGLAVAPAFVSLAWMACLSTFMYLKWNRAVACLILKDQRFVSGAINISRLYEILSASL